MSEQAPQITLADLAGERTLICVPRTDLVNPLDTNACGAVFCLDDTTYLIFEDPDDGYRSHAGPLLYFRGAPYALGGSPEYLHEPVLCSHETRGQYGTEDDVLSIRSRKTGREIFRVGTENVADYYPSFIAQWTPENLSANTDEESAQ